MKTWLAIVAGIILIMGGGWGWGQGGRRLTAGRQNPPSETGAGQPLHLVGAIERKVVAAGLDTPWAIAFLPEGGMLVTERKGTVRLGGKQGILEEERVIVDRIPGAANHNGGRIKFGQDRLLYIATGDAQEPSRAQDTNSLAGKILRVTDAGQPAAGNSFNNAVYSYGHRNVQGLAWDQNGTLWATEHGRSGALSGLDELNLIVLGKNYGWPEIAGDETRVGMEAPVKHSGATVTWAP